ncbi:MAG TPA: carboxypeptidase regulatory-like domain-containing protein [Galbitalea sp.]|nr:carboxypeptidase regulatory-like domain-containing protein [Galbitalea sp.]
MTTTPSSILRGKSVVLAIVVALLAAFAFVGGSAASASADGTGSISGTVYGADAPTTPLWGIAVVLNLPGGSYVQNATTGDDGSYSFTGLPAAGYVLHFLPVFGQAYQGQWWNNQASQGTATVLTLGEGQAATADVTLVSAPQTATISGTVRDSNGVGVPSAQVSATPVDENQLGYGLTPGFATTDSSGSFTMTGLQADTYTVQFSPPFNSNYTATWWNGKSDATEADTLTVTSGEAITGIDGSLGTGATISGFVDAADNPGVGLDGGQVLAVNAAGNDVGFGSVFGGGNYTMSGIPSGRYTLEFYPPVNTNYSPTWWQGESSLASADFFSVTAGSALTGYNADLPLAASISGTLFGAGSPEVPMSGGSVYAYSTSGTGDGNTGFVNPDGSYTIPNLAAGSYTLDFQAPSADNHAQQWWEDASSAAASTPVTVSSGQAMVGINAVLGVGATISGTVQGTAASGALFAAQNAQIYIYLPDGTLYSDSGMTDVSGSYSLANLTPGSYLLDFVPQPDTTDFVPQWWKNKSSQASATPITVRAGQTKANVDVVFANSTLKATTPKISGAAKVGHTLTAKPGKWGPGTVTFSYQWSRDGAALAGATSSTYALTNADAASTISVTVTGSKTGYTTQSLTSASTAAITGGTLSSAVPTITGTASHGQTLTAVPGTWGPGTVALTYKWFRGSKRIAGATSSSYAPVSADVGKAITVKVTGAETGFTTATVASAPTAIVH